MGIGFGFSSSKSKNTIDQTQTLTPTNPEWVGSTLEGLTGKINDLGNIDPQSLVAGTNGFHDQAGAGLGGINMGAGLTGVDTGAGRSFADASTFYGRAANGGAAAYNPAMMDDPGAVNGTRASTFMDAYRNPWENQVVNTSLADYDVGAGQTRQADMLARGADSTFGGSGGGIQTAMSNDAIMRGRGALAAGLRSQGFTTALGAGQADADRAQQANLTSYQALVSRLAANQGAKNNAWQFNAGQQDNNLNRMLLAGQGLTGLGVSQGDAARAQDANTRANATALDAHGELLRQIDQARRTAGMDLLGNQVSLIGSLPLDLLHGQTDHTQGTSTGKNSGFSLSASYGGK